MKRYAVVPGSFDPITLGHADLIRRAASIFGSCLVLVMNNQEKNYRFSIRERFEMCRAAFIEDENITVDFYEGWLYEYLADKKEEAILVKGVRDSRDFEYEKKMASFNFAHCGVETMYLDASDEFSHLSSTLVRQKMEEKEELSPYLPENVVKHLQNKL